MCSKLVDLDDDDSNKTNKKLLIDLLTNKYMTEGFLDSGKMLLQIIAIKCLPEMFFYVSQKI